MPTDRSRATSSAPLPRVGGPRARALRRVVRDVSALGRPRSDPQRALSARRPPTAAHRRSRVRRRLPAADPSDRPQLPEGTQQRARAPRRAILAVRGRLDRRTAATPPSTRASARSTISTRSVARRRPARPRGGARSRLAVLARPPVGSRAPRVVPPPAGRHASSTRENPPKKYQDIYPLDFECEDWRGALARAARGHAVLDRSRRRDLPRRQPAHQDVRLLGMADRRSARASSWRRSSLPRRSRARSRCATWRSSASRSRTPTSRGGTRSRSSPSTSPSSRAPTSREYLRPNLFANTPDILHAYLQHGGRPAFDARLVLAATLGASYGIYSGFELCEATALRPGSEEYLGFGEIPVQASATGSSPETSANWSAASTRYGASTRRFRSHRPLAFHETDNPQIIAYSKTARRTDCSSSSTSTRIICSTASSTASVDLPSVRGARSAWTATTYTWHRGWNYVASTPASGRRTFSPCRRRHRGTHDAWLPPNIRLYPPPLDNRRPGACPIRIRSGTRTRSSTRRTSSRSSTATTTASAISRGSRRSSITCRASASPAYGCCRSSRRRCATTVTTSRIT